MIQHRVVVSMEYANRKTLPKLSNGTIFNVTPIIDAEYTSNGTR